MKQKSWDQNFAEIDSKITKTTTKILQMDNCKIVMPKLCTKLPNIGLYFSFGLVKQMVDEAFKVL